MDRQGEADGFYRFAQICCSEAFVKTAKKVQISTGVSVGTLSDVKQDDNAGSFCFPLAQQQIPALRNRFIVWRSSGAFLFLEEYSLDKNLSNNATTVHFQNSIILKGVEVLSVGTDYVFILVPTVTSVHRFVVRHPWKKLHKSAGTGSFEEALPSILDDLDESCGLDSANWVGIDENGLEGTPQLAACAVNSSLQAVFALAYNDATILLVTFPAYGSSGSHSPIQEIIRPTSAAKRIWNGLVTPFTRSSEDFFVETTVSALIHPDEEDTLLFTVSKDYQLRVWSCNTKKLKCSMDLPSCIAKYQCSRAEILLSQANKSVLKKCVMGHTVFIAVFVCINGSNEFVILCPTARRTQIAIAKVIGFEGPDLQLIDFSLTASFLWTMWLDSSNKTVVKYKPVSLVDVEHGPWSEIQGHSSSDLSLVAHFNAAALEDNITEVGLNAILKPGRFTFDTIVRALKVISKEPVVLARNDWSELSKTLINWAENCRKGNLSLDVSRISVSCVDVDFNESGRPDADLTELLFWKSLCSSCIQFSEAARKPLAILACSEIELYGFIMTDRFSVFLPVESSLSSIGLWNTSFRLHADGFLLSECLEKAKKIFPRNDWIILHKLLKEKNDNHVCKVFYDKAQMILSDPKRQSAVKELFRCLLNVEHCLSDFTETVIRKLEAGVFHGVLSAESSPEYESFLRSRLASGFLAAGFESTVNFRLDLCCNLLVVLAFAMSWKEQLSIVNESWCALEQEHIPRLTQVCQAYETLSWIAEIQASKVTLDKLESSVRLMSELSLKQPAGGEVPMMTELLIANLFRNGTAAAVLRRLLSEQLEGGVYNGVPLVWGTGAAELISLALIALWPCSPFLIFPDFLMATGQYEHLMMYCAQPAPWRGELVFAKWFYRGLAALQLDKPEMAFDSVIRAFAGVDLNDGVLRKKLFRPEAEAIGCFGTEYFLKLGSLFERRGFIQQAIKITESAIKIATDEDKNLAKLWTVLFRNQLNIGSYQEALVSVQNNGDVDMQKNCLRQLILSLLHEEKYGELISLNFGRLEPDAVEILESKARSVDIVESAVNYYDLLYAYYVARSNFRKAALSLYEYSCRLSVEASGELSLRKQMRALSTCICALNSVKRTEYRWLVRPSVLNSEIISDGRSPKRSFEGENVTNKSKSQRKIEIIELTDIRKEYLLVQVKIILLDCARKTESNTKLPKLISSGSVTELVELLIKNDLFDLATSVSIAFQLPLQRIIEALATKCVQCVKIDMFIKSIDLDGQRRGKKVGLGWVDQNRMIFSKSSWDGNSSDVTWKFLEAYVDHFCSLECPSLILHAVSNQLLSLGYSLPTWLFARYKKVNLDDCVRLLLSYDKLSEAESVLSEYIDAVLGTGLEQFDLKVHLTKCDLNLQNSLQPAAPAVWIPYSVVEQALQLMSSKRDPEIQSHLKRLEKQMGRYFTQLESVSAVQQIPRRGVLTSCH